uniref:Ycf80 n=1 Tax=Balbiania investiens TaxID=111861 RepID=A0A4D6BLG2_9FLOR|nr:hypothetical protein [Balbiania investiens]QBX88691.1 hypothetical protein [Balbiania investiens]
MGLFNLIYVTLLSEPPLKNSSSDEVSFSYIPASSMKCLERSVKVVSTQTDLKISSRPLFLATESVYRFGKLHAKKNNLFHALIDKYWEQKIFISVSTPLSKKYVTRLAKKETALTKNMRKQLLIQLSKALLGRRINIYSTNYNIPDVQQLRSSVIYTWKKSFNIEAPKHWNRLWKNQRTTDFPNLLQLSLLNKLQNNYLPLFTVANGLRQIIVAEPAEELILDNNCASSLYQWYYDRFIWEKDNSIIHEGWFFINHQDAEEYKEYIRIKYPRSANLNKLKILCTGIDFYYQLNRISPPRTQFRLFPDLVEVGKLIKNSKHRKDLTFDPRQKYGKDFFQGQPIYFIEPVICKKIHSNNQAVINYYYQMPLDSSTQKYPAVFLNKDVAIVAWKKFRTMMPDYKLPKYPKLRVYNLEDFIKDHESDELTNQQKFLLVPGEESYKRINDIHQEEQHSYGLYKIARFSSALILRAKLWSKKIVWSLTSRQPPN